MNVPWAKHKAYLPTAVNHILGMDTSGTSKSTSSILSFHTLDHLKRIRVTVYQADSRGQQNQSSSLSLFLAHVHTCTDTLTDTSPLFTGVNSSVRLCQREQDVTRIPSRM